MGVNSVMTTTTTTTTKKKSDDNYKLFRDVKIGKQLPTEITEIEDKRWRNFPFYPLGVWDLLSQVVRHLIRGQRLLRLPPGHQVGREETVTR